MFSTLPPTTSDTNRSDAAIGLEVFGKWNYEFLRECRTLAAEIIQLLRRARRGRG